MQEQPAENYLAYKITLGILGLLMIVLGVVNIIVFSTPRSTDSPAPRTETANVKNGFDVNFDSLTKEQTVAAFKTMQQPDYLPEGLADQALAPNNNETYLVLDYSYESGTIDELKEIDFSVSNFGKNEITATPVGDYYVVITTDSYKEKDPPSYRPRAVSFNKNYVNYYREQDGFSLDEYVVFTNTSSPVVEITLPVFAVTDSMTQPNTVYSYKLMENADSYELTLNCIGVGVDMEALSTMVSSGNQPIAVTDYPYTITHYTATLNLDKNTGKPQWNRDSNGSAINTKKTFRLNEQEINDLAEYLVQS